MDIFHYCKVLIETSRLSLLFPLANLVLNFLELTYPPSLPHCQASSKSHTDYSKSKPCSAGVTEAFSLMHLLHYFSHRWKGACVYVVLSQLCVDDRTLSKLLFALVFLAITEMNSTLNYSIIFLSAQYLESKD